MKKIIKVLSLAALMAIPTTSFAQSTDNCNKKCEATTCCPNKENKQCADTCALQCKKGCTANNDSCAAATKCNKTCNTGCCANCKKNVEAKKRGFRGERHDKRNMGKRMPQSVLFQGITLTAEQQQKIRALAMQRRADNQKAKAEDAEKNAEEFQKRIAAYDKEIENILTPEQFKQYQANKESMKSRRSMGEKRMPE